MARMTPEETQVVVDYIKSNGGKTAKEFANVLNVSRSVIDGIKGRYNLGAFFSAETRSGIMDSGSSLQGVKAMREPTKADMSRLRAICEERGLPFDKWGIWWDKTKEHSIAFYNKEAQQADEKSREEFLKRIQKVAPRVASRPVPTNNLVIPSNFDVHIGKHCEIIRTGNEYTPDMAVKRVLEGQAALYQLTKPHGVSDIILPLGNDIVHVNNNRNETANGTPQDNYGSVESQMRLAAELYIRSIECFAKKHNVWLCHVPSNHDKETGWAVSQMVSCYFQGSKNPRVHVREDLMNQHYRKYFVFGDNLIMFHHGDMRKEEKLLGLITAEARDAVSKTKRIYVYQGDVHHKTRSGRGANTEVDLEKDHTALTIMRSGGQAGNNLFVETVRSPSPADDWHSKSAFLNLPAVEMFLHNEHAQFGRFTHWF